jgi:NADP-dependent 3-hydroxy acid dehydrogenase YdfG
MEKPVAMIVGGSSGIGADSARKLEAFEPDPDFPTAWRRNPTAWLEDLLDVTQKCVNPLKLLPF